MKTKKNEPLPKHTRLDWEECYAKVVLESIYKNEFSVLKIKDKPDLQDEDNEIGIECTVSVDEKFQEAEKLYINLINNKVNNSHKCKGRIKQLGGEITEYMLFQSGKNSLTNIFNAVKIKLKKLNGKNYKIFKNNYLLIRDSIYISDDEILEMQYSIDTMQSKYNIKFNKIYLLLDDKIIELNMIDYTNKTIEIESSIQYELAQKARKIVLEYEEGGQYESYKNDENNWF